MRIDHRPDTDVRADVDVHRRHTDDALSQVGAVANRRASRHDSNPGANIEPLQRHRVLVDERPTSMIRRHVDDDPDAKSEENSLLDPGVYTPAGWRGSVRLGSANAAG